MDSSRRDLAGIFLITVGAWLLLTQFYAQSTAGDGIEQQPALEAAEHGRVAALREQLSLRNEHLAAAGLSQAQGELLLKAFRDWFGGKKEQLASAQRAVNQAKQQLHLAWRKVGKGQAGTKQQAAALIAQRQSALAQANQTREDLVATAVPVIEAKLTNDQKQLWQTVRANIALGAFGQYIYAPGLTARQLKDLKLAHRTRGLKLAAAKDDSQRTQAVAAFESAVDKILTSAQKQAIAAAKTNAADKSLAVQAADNKVFPLPAQLRPEQDVEVPAPPP